MISIALYRPTKIKDRDSGAWKVVPGWRPEMHALTWDQLVRGLTSFRVHAAKAEARSWSPVILTEDEDGQLRRRKDLVVAVTCLVLDLDDGRSSLAAAGSRWLDVAHLVHTTWSHTPDKPKGRLVVPLAAPCPAALYPRLWRWAQARMGGAADEQAKDCSRLYFVPSVRSEDWPRAAWAVAGEPLVLDYAGLPDPRPPRPPYTPRPIYDSDPAGAQRERRRALARDPGARARAADVLGARILGDRAKGARCPKCGDSSVWWLIAPERWTGAACDHRQSCGWAGGLLELLETT